MQIKITTHSIIHNTISYIYIYIYFVLIQLIHLTGNTFLKLISIICLYDTHHSQINGQILYGRNHLNASAIIKSVTSSIVKLIILR